MSKAQKLNGIGIVFACLFALFCQLVWLFDTIRIGTHGHIYWIEVMNVLIYSCVIIPMIWFLTSVYRLFIILATIIKLNKISFLHFVLISGKVSVIVSTCLAINFIISRPEQLIWFGASLFTAWFLILLDLILEDIDCKKSFPTKSFSVLVVSIVVMFLLLWPSNQFVKYPGLTLNMTQYATVETYTEKEHIMGVLIYVRPAAPIDWLYAKLFPFYDIYDEIEQNQQSYLDQMLHDGNVLSIQGVGHQSALHERAIEESDLKQPLPDSQLNAQVLETRLLKENADRIAIGFALQETGYIEELVPDGALVTNVTNDSPFAHKLQIGDLIIQVDEELIQTASHFEQYIHRVNSTSVNITFKRDSTIKTIPLYLHHNVQMQEELLNHIEVVDGVLVNSPMTINKTSYIMHEGGPSHGSMLALALIHQLTPGGITNGHVIAGTGSLSIDGTIGPVGGVKQKAFSVERAGADVFFVPEVQYEEAQEGANHLHIVPVHSMQDILQWLKINPKQTTH